MAKRARIGAMRTRIRIMDWPTKDPSTQTDADGYRDQKRVNVFGEGKTRACMWANAHGSEVYTAHQAGVLEPATLTMRWSPKITSTAEIYRDQDSQPYEVISLNDVENRHVWLEIKVKRKAAAQ